MLTSRRVAVLCTLLVFLIVGIVAVLLRPSLIHSYPKTKQTSEPTDLEDVVITMERGACMGVCPVYSLTIYGNGTVIYEGVWWVNVTGKQISQISQDKVKELADEFYRIDYFSLNDSYTIPGVMDLPSTTTSITINGKTKSVYNYGNEAPTKLVELENKIDEITNSSKWVKPHPLWGNSHHTRAVRNPLFWASVGIAGLILIILAACMRALSKMRAHDQVPAQILPLA